MTDKKGEAKARPKVRMREDKYGLGSYYVMPPEGWLFSYYGVKTEIIHLRRKTEAEKALEGGRTR